MSSSDAPGRGLFKVERALEHEDQRAAELEETMWHIEAELRGANSRQAELLTAITAAEYDFSEVCANAGISNELWREYEAFCESLEPSFGSRGGWSVTCYQNHGGSYVGYDPDLDLFMQSAKMPLGACNFRCEASIDSVFEASKTGIHGGVLAVRKP